MSSLLLSLPGTKAKLARRHVTMFPRSRWHVSVFGGATSEFMYRTPSGIEVCNDIDSDVHNMFKVVRDPTQCEALRRMLVCTPHGRRQFTECRGTLDDSDPVLRAWSFSTATS